MFGIILCFRLNPPKLVSSLKRTPSPIIIHNHHPTITSDLGPLNPSASSGRTSRGCSSRRRLLGLPSSFQRMASGRCPSDRSDWDCQTGLRHDGQGLVPQGSVWGGRTYMAVPLGVSGSMMFLISLILQQGGK